MTERTSEIIKDLLWGCCAITLTICAIVITRDLHSALKQTNQTLGRLDDAAKHQIENIESPSYQASLKSSIEVGAALKGSVLQWNKQGIPERMAHMIGSVDRTITTLNETAAASRDLIRASDDRLNGDKGVFLELTATLRHVSSQSDVVVKQVTELLSSTNLAVQDLTEVERAVLVIVKDPAWQETLGEIRDGVRAGRLSSEHIEEALRSAPVVASNIEKISTTASRFTKATLIVDILATIARAFIP